MGSAGRPSLAETLGFTQDELAANRAGRMSDAQRERMKTSRSRGRAGTVVMGVVVVVFIVVIATVVLPKRSSQQGSGSSPSTMAAVGGLAVVAVVMSFSLRRARRSLDLLVPERVESVVGTVTTRVHELHGNVGDPSTGMVGYGGGVRFEVTIAGIRFFVANEAVLEAFEEGRSYRGYYVGRGTMATLLSAEPTPAAT